MWEVADIPVLSAEGPAGLFALDETELTIIAMKDVPLGSAPGAKHITTCAGNVNGFGIRPTSAGNAKFELRA